MALGASLATEAQEQGEILHVLTGGGTAGLGLGQAVGPAGDVDGDGLDDVIVGFRNGSGSKAGTARVHSGADGSVLFTFTGKVANDLFGQAVDGAGDVNGDGFADVIVGAVGEDANGLDSGAAYVFSGQNGSVLHKFVGSFAKARFGGAVSDAGDVDGDGFADVIVGGQPDNGTPQPNGHARVLSGASGAVLFDFIGTPITSRLGCDVDLAGDVDGDGVGDFVVGDWRDHTAGNSAGSVSVFSGQSGALLFKRFGVKSGDQLGLCVAGIGDMDGDGRSEFLAGTGWADSTITDVGMVRVYAGADGATLHTFYGEAMFDFYGAAAAGVGDFDADGAVDFAVGAFGDDDGGSNSGSLRVYSGVDGAQIFRIDGNSAADELGFSVSAAGAVSGTGSQDLVVGAPVDNQGGGSGSGTAYVIAGAPPPVKVYTYCTPGPNQWGPGATMGYLGSTSVAAKDLVLTVDGARPKSVGLFFFGARQQEKPFMKGFLCIGGKLYRAGPPIHLDRSGSGQLAIGARSRPWDEGLLVAGSTWNFQFIYLDPPSRGKGPPLNLSDALSAEFVP
jgi:hypothetical protein